MEMLMEKGQSPYCFPEQRKVILDPAQRSKFSVYYGRILKRLGIDGKSFHCLRHAFATRLNKAGITIEEIGKLLGHSNEKTTTGYVHRYGEWCFAKHTLPYEALPDWFLAFDVFEPATGLFWSCDRRNELLVSVGISPVPELFRGRLPANRIEKLIGQSRLGASHMEGIYLRREDADALVSRAKVVGAEFKQQIEEHWPRRALVANRVRA